MVKKKYTSSDIEVLKGIEPVQKRPGMYTDTTNPNHLIQELIDNIWSDTVTDNNLASKIENNILNEARNLRVNANK